MAEDNDRTKCTTQAAELEKDVPSFMQMLKDMFIRDGLGDDKRGQPLPAASKMCGDFDHIMPEGLPVRYRLLGMRQVRVDKHLIEFEVQRIPYPIEEKFYYDQGQLAVLKMAWHSTKEDEWQLQNEAAAFRALDESFSLDYLKRRHFAEILGYGSFTSLNFTSKDDHCDMRPLLNPRPYFLLERPVHLLAFCLRKFTVSLDYVMRVPRYDMLPLPTACFLAIGCIRALRTLHEIGWIMREVSPARFSLRMHPSCLLQTTEASLMESIAITSLPFACRYRTADGVPPRSRFAEVYNVKYCSPMVSTEMRRQIPGDDVISVLFMLAEMAIGRLPWGILQPVGHDNMETAKDKKTKQELRANQQQIFKKKHEFMHCKELRSLRKEKPVLFHGYSDLFKFVLKTAAKNEQQFIDRNPITEPVEYSELCKAIANQAEARKSNSSIFGFADQINRAYTRQQSSEPAESTAGTIVDETSDDDIPMQIVQKTSDTGTSTARKRLNTLLNEGSAADKSKKADQEKGEKSKSQKKSEKKK